MEKRCVLCQTKAAAHPLCNYCFAQLPWLTPGCSQCAAPLSTPSALYCGRCLKHPPPFQQIIVPFAYTGVIRDWLIQFKYQHNLLYGRYLARLFLQFWHDNGLPTPTALVPLPSAMRRLSWRGFNPTVELAKPMARAWHASLQRHQLKKKHSKAQQGLPLKQRQQNTQHFYLKKPCDANAVLFDDVVTTTATVRAASKVMGNTPLVLAIARA